MIVGSRRKQRGALRTHDSAGEAPPQTKHKGEVGGSQKRLRPPAAERLAEPWSDSLTANPGQRLTVPDSLTALTALL